MDGVAPATITVQAEYMEKLKGIFVITFIFV
jgi:hypothetical protein